MNQDKAILDKIKNDPFAISLGAEILNVKPGFAEVSLTITERMMNFHGMTHGGLVFSLGDIAFAAASNSYGQTALAMNVNVHFIKPTFSGDTLVAVAEEISMGGRTALYDISVKNKRTGEVVSRSQGLVYRKKERFVE